MGSSSDHEWAPRLAKKPTILPNERGGRYARFKGERGAKCKSRSGRKRKEHDFDRDGNCYFCPAKSKGEE